MILNNINLKRWGGPIVLSVIVLFCITTLVLHAKLAELELSQTADWRQSKLRQLERVAAKVNGLLKKKKKTSNDPVLRHHQKKTVRQVFEEQHGVDMERIRSAVEALRHPSPLTQPNMTYDILNCPEQPPPGYPQAWNILDVLTWNPDDTDIPNRIYQGLCVFDFEKDYEKAFNYRQAELPFVLFNQPDILRTTERWSHAHYLPKLIGPQPQRNEHSTNHHFMFWRTKHLKKIPKHWKAPTDNVDLSYTQWLKRAQQVQQSTRDHTTLEHWYFRLNGEFESMNQYLYDELPIFNPTQDSFFMVEHKQARGINCRFGMKGVIAEAHFDPTRNFIVLLGGQRRYILAHPDQCQNMELYDFNHPSGRHSKVDWSNPKTTPPFSQAQVQEVVLQAGDALYLPTSWFHYIVSLNINYQCNARSGTTDENKHFIHECGFIV